MAASIGALISGVCILGIVCAVCNVIKSRKKNGIEN